MHVNTDDPAFVGGLEVPAEQLLANLVWAARSRTISTVWVAGERVLDHGEPVRLDRAAVQAAANESAAYLRTPAWPE